MNPRFPVLDLTRGWELACPEGQVVGPRTQRWLQIPVSCFPQTRIESGSSLQPSGGLRDTVRRNLSRW
jgi:hypothetical protein